MKKPEHSDLQTLADIIMDVLSRTNILKMKSEELDSRINAAESRIEIVLNLADNKNVNFCRTVHLCIICADEKSVIRIFPLLRALSIEAAGKMERFANAIRFNFEEVFEINCDQIRKLLYNQPLDKPLKIDK